MVQSTVGLDFAAGVWGKDGYMSDRWNRFDFFIVWIGVVDLMPVRSTRIGEPLISTPSLHPLSSGGRIMVPADLGFFFVLV
jgi:hypothetical protein